LGGEGGGGGGGGDAEVQQVADAQLNRRHLRELGKSSLINISLYIVQCTGTVNSIRTKKTLTGGN
jgi:hypothetical protein